MNILIACSDTVTLGLLKQALSDTGAEIATYSDPQGVVDACKSQSYDIVITMCTHPFLNGSDIMRKMHKPGKVAPALCLISWIQHEQTVLSLYENDVSQYFTFPINLPRLAGRIKDKLYEISQ